MTGREREQKDKSCQCPYCNSPAEEPLPFCHLCGAAIVRCPSCGKVLQKGETRCPACGGEAEQTAHQRD